MKQETPKPIHEQIIDLCGGEEQFKEIAGLKPKQEIKLEDIFNYEKKRGLRDLIDAHKQETLEEASWKHNPLKKLDGEFLRHAFKEGAKWQAERMYSEEELYNLLEGAIKDCHLWELEEHYSGDYKNLKEWFKQFKNK